MKFYLDKHSNNVALYQSEVTLEITLDVLLFGNGELISNNNDIHKQYQLRS